MAPDIGQRIDTVLQALEDIVMPAIDPAQPAAREQLGYAMAALRLIVSQHDKAYSLAVMEVRLFARLLLQLDEAAGDALAPDLQRRLREAGAARVTDLQVPAQSRLDNLQREYREIADAVVAAISGGADADARMRITAIVIEHSFEETTMRRSWMAMPGVEADVSKLPSLDVIVNPAILPI